MHSSTESLVIKPEDRHGFVSGMKFTTHVAGLLKPYVITMLYDVITVGGTNVSNE